MAHRVDAMCRVLRAIRKFAALPKMDPGSLCNMMVAETDW